MPNGHNLPKIVGNAWGEYVFGTLDHDRIDGRGGNDTINGMCGNDTITGGTGSDTFVMDCKYQYWTGGKDVITDFATNPFSHDTIQFNGWGKFVAAPTGGCYLGETFTTDWGHTLTVTADASGSVMLSWDTGDSFTLAGVSAASFDAGWIVSA